MRFNVLPIDSLIYIYIEMILPMWVLQLWFPMFPLDVLRCVRDNNSFLYQYMNANRAILQGTDINTSIYLYKLEL